MRLFFLALICLILPDPRAARAEDPAPAAAPTVLVELFTSQGCNACPPADALLAALAAEEGIVALSLHVDYWDYLGWRDSFGRPENTRRQKAYAAEDNARSIYTPQMIVQGRWRRVGSDVAAVRAAIETARARDARVVLELTAREDHVIVRVRPLGTLSFETTGVLHLVTYDRPQTVRIDRGENAGRDITYVNVVRDWMKLGYWDGTAERVYDAPLPVMGQGLAVLLQDGPVGEVLAAATLEP